MGRAEPISVIKTRVELGHTGEPVKHIDVNGRDTVLLGLHTLRL